MVLNIGLWVAIGVFGGMVLAMFIFALEPRGPDRGQVALIVLAGFILLATLTGLVISGTGLKRHFSLKKANKSS